jgi:uncharacterized protein (DUF58 family)
MPRRRREELFDEALLGRLQRLHLIAKRMAFRGRGGRRRSRGVGDGLEFADHRDYAPGDDLRFIDWAYYARMEKLLLRLFHRHSEAPVALLVDVSASMAAPNEGKLLYALRTAAAMAYVAMGGLERVVLVPFSDRLHPPLTTGRNRGEIPRVLDFLAELAAGGRTDLVRCAEQFARAYGSAGTVLLLSDLCDARVALPAALGRLTADGRDVAVVHVLDTPSAEVSGPVVLQHAETGTEMTAVVTGELLRAVDERREAQRAACERACAARDAAYVAAPTDLPFERLVLHSLRRAGVVAG